MDKELEVILVSFFCLGGDPTRSAGRRLRYAHFAVGNTWIKHLAATIPPGINEN